MVSRHSSVSARTPLTYSAEYHRRRRYALAVDPHDRDSVVAPLDDPIVMDLALAEGGWFEQFLDERGELLPNDEALMARSWERVDRTVRRRLAMVAIRLVTSIP